LITGASEAAREEADKNLDVLDAVVKENLELENAKDRLVLLKRELVVVLDRKTPLDAAKEVRVKFAVALRRHDAGMLKQQGRPIVVTELGASTPL
jgi:hypothetical protein